MTPERWAQIQAVFAAAVERSGQSRGAYLSQVCADDTELRREVESLLATHDSASARFLESPAGLDETEIQATPPRGSQQRLLPGTRLGTYEVLSSIGAGGMGEVYRARDYKLQREVAVKVLPHSFANDPDALARFEREALAVAALSHPNILAIYDFGRQDDTVYAVMELLEGHTLREKLKAGPLPVNLVLHYSLQIVEGLSAAHEKEIVHRDLKPENLFVTKDGRVKILDFGLAKRVERVAPGEETSAPTVEGGQTRAGMVMGTLGYMSPEQLLGQDVDHRADLFSFGVVLYEMVGRTAPFKGNSAVAIADAILHKPPPELTDKALPPRLKLLIRRLLEKDPARRYATAAETLAEMKALEASLAPGRFRLSRRARVAAAAAMLAAVAAGGWLWHRVSRERWALQTAAPEISRLIENADFFEAAALARQARAILPKDPTLEKLWMRATDEITIVTDPAGAVVSYRPYSGDNWQPLGKTPLESIRVANGVAVWRIARDGFAPAFLVDGPTMSWTFKLLPVSTSPPGMVPVAGGETGLSTPFVESPALQIQAFLMDRYEVTNADFKKFVDAGGYERPELWKAPFVREGRTVMWKEAVEGFRDMTGRPGPATWEAGSYPPGSEKRPVAGVSWYEASAYAEFVGKRLPTAYHWILAAQTYAADVIVPGSNFHGDRTQPVGEPATLSGFGTSDMAGNVKEWCLNESEEGKRLILGGGFGEPIYMFGQLDAGVPWDRLPNYGFRCARWDSAPPPASARLERSARDYRKEPVASDEAYRAYSGLYAYDRTALETRIEGTQDNADWIQEKVTFTAAYGGERVPAYLYLPKKAERPLQAVIYSPGGYSMVMDKLDPALEEPGLGFLPRSGRAVVYPIYKGTYERRVEGVRPGSAKPRDKWRDRILMMSKDLGRTIDYLESRPDIDSTKIAYFGFSAGGAFAPMLLSAEPRMKAAIISAGGFPYYRPLPEVDWINFITRMKTPLLMLGGRLDDYFPLESSQLPYFHRAGAPEKDKKLVLYDVTHGAIPQREMIRETLDWLDKYLGPVKR